jgi:hypothetical protein
MKVFLFSLFTLIGTLVYSQCSINVNLSVNNATDSSLCDGSILATTTGNNGPVTYSWNCNGCVNFNSPSLSDLCFGSNGTLIVTDTAGCAGTAIWNIGSSSCSSFGAIITSTPTSGTNSCDGSILASPYGGTAPYYYSVGNGTVFYGSNNPTNLCAGNYTVDVSDANGCSFSTTTIVVVDSCAGLAVSFSNVVNPSPASCDGSITPIVSGGSGPYTFTWSNGMTTMNAYNLCQGNYTVCVTDMMNGCQVCDSITIYDSTNVNCAGFNANLNITNVSASGLCDGSIVPTVNGGTAPYIYQWSNGSTSSTQTNLCTGLYSLTVTDPNGCSASASGYVGAGGANVGDTIILNGNISNDSTVIGTISGTWIDNCSFDYNTITSASILSYVDLVDSTVVTWTIGFNDGTSTTVNATYLFSPGTTGTYNVILQLYCGLKSNPQWLVAYDQLLYEGTASLNSLEDKNVLIFPNPAQTEINFLGLNKTSTYQIVDQFGRIIVANSDQKQLNISNFEKGIYSVIIQNESSVKIIRFVKQ